MASLTRKFENINTKKNIFEDNRIFCETCKVWICGIFEIDSHFIVHSFKTWNVSSQSSTAEGLKQKSENVAEYKNRISDVSRISVFDVTTGKQKQLLATLFDHKGFPEKVSKYFADDEDTLNNDDHNEDDNASTATTVPRGEQLLNNGQQNRNAYIKQEKVESTNCLTNDAIAFNQKERVEMETEVCSVTNMDGSNNSIENGKCYKTPRKRQKTLYTENIQHQKTSDLARANCSYSENDSSTWTFPIDSIQDYEQSCRPLWKNGAHDKFSSALFTARESIMTMKMEKTLSPSKSVVSSLLSREEISPRPATKDAKRNSYSHLQNLNDVPPKKAKLQKVESTEKQNKNRISVKSSNKLKNNSKGTLDRYTIIQPFPEFDRDKSGLNISDTDSSSQSVRRDFNSKNNGKESKLNNKRKEAKESRLNNSKNEPTEAGIKPLNKLYLKKSSSVVPTCNEKTTLVSGGEKLEKKKKIKNRHSLEEYIRMKNKSDSPLTSDQIQQLRLIREEVIAAPYKGKISTKVEEAMESTYNLRYTELRVNIMPIKDSLKIFPGLQNYTLLKLEFERCTHRSLKGFSPKLNKFFEELIFKEKRYMKLSDKYRMCKKAMQTLNESPVDPKLQENVGMILFGYKVTKGNWNGSLFHCRKKEDNVILEKITPFIDIIKEDLWTPYKKMDVYVERAKVGRVPCFYDAVIMVYVIYWVFNLEYDDSLRPVFEYFDWIVGNPQNTYK